MSKEHYQKHNTNAAINPQLDSWAFAILSFSILNAVSLCRKNTSRTLTPQVMMLRASPLQATVTPFMMPPAQRTRGQIVNRSRAFVARVLVKFFHALRRRSWVRLMGRCLRRFKCPLSVCCWVIFYSLRSLGLNHLHILRLL